MRLTFAGLAVGCALVFGQAALQRAVSQSPPAADRTEPSESLPADFIDSRPIVAYFDGRAMPDTVRGLLEELKRPDRCAKDAGISQMEACALVFYRLDEEFSPDRLRPPFIMRAIYRVSDEANLADTVITMPDSQGVLQRYVGGRLFEPLRNVRANVCLQRKGGTCTPTDSKGVLYIPYAILGKIENDREGILPGRSAAKHFSIVAESQEFAERLKSEQLLAICRYWKVCQ